MFSNSRGSERRPTTRTAIWYVLFRIGRRSAELTCSNLDVLLRERTCDVERGKTASGKSCWVKPDTHCILALTKDDDIANARNALEGILDIDVEVIGDERL